jgi:ABC-2 type transport system permease protein
MSSSKKPSQMRAYLSLTKFALKASIRNKSTLFFSIIFPIVFIVALGLIGGGGVSVKIGIPDGQIANPIQSVVSNISTIKIEKGTNDFLKGELEKGKIDAVLKSIHKMLDFIL